MNYRTRQREAVLRVLSHEDKPLTAQVILTKANAICPGIGAATVFRTLKEAMQSGEISKVELPGLPPHYELRRDRHHHFFVCQTCHDIQPLEGCVQGLNRLLPKGSRMRDHEVVIFGDCSECASDESHGFKGT
jgi:Fur family ferric uptake transcriptional regulator